MINFQSMVRPKNRIFVVTTEAFMQTRLIQEHKDKTITHMVSDVLMWFG